jgi:tetratricopeptide (TPR) repeat protein/DNA-binding winged helix-turn-helix (wHTH) protein
MEQPQIHTYQFADIEVDPLKGCVRRGSRELEKPVRLSQHDFAVLLYLIENRHRLVSKDELLDNFWKDAEVTPDSLVQCVRKIRRAIGDDSRSPRFVETVPKVGYHFIGKLDDRAPLASVMDSPVAELSVATVLPITQDVPPWRRRKAFVAGTLCLAVLATISLYLYFQGNSTAAVPRLTATTAAAASGKKAVAVMLFENLSGDRELDWLSAGLADMLITDFSRSEHLTAINREQLRLLLERNARNERNDQKPGAKIPFELGMKLAREAGADAFVVGTFAKFGEKLRIDVRLLDARSGHPLQSESLNIDKFDQIPTQIDLLTLKLASQLGAPAVELEHASSLSQVRTNSLEAYRCYSLALEKAESLHNTEAVALLEKAIALDPEFAMAHARIGYVYAVRWNLIDKAKPFLERAFRLSERLGEKDRLLITAWYHIASGDYPAAIRSYQEFTANYPLEVEARLRLGHLLAGEGQSAEAIDVLKQGLAIDPESRDIYNELGNLYSTLGRHDEAIAMHQHYVALAPNEANAHDSLGLSLQWAGRYSEAIVEYNRALGLNPNFEVALVHLANAHFQTGRYRQALTLFQRYIRLAPSDTERARGYGCIANIYLRKGQLAQAAQAAKLEVGSKKSELGTQILVALRRGNTGAAEKLVQQSREFTDANRGARNSGRASYYFDGLLALKQGDADQAIGKFKAALAQEPPRWAIDSLEDCLARGYLDAGRLPEGIKEYERILAANPNYPLGQYHLAQAYERNGQRDMAVASYQLFLQAWPDADPDLAEITNARKFINQR